MRKIDNLKLIVAQGKGQGVSKLLQTHLISCKRFEAA
jgi:hypothetical protein